MIAVVILRDRPATSATRVSAALVGAGAASAIVVAPGFHAEWRWFLPLIALSSSGQIAFWLWARAAFDDDFAFQPWHGGLWAVLVGMDLVVSYGAITGAVASMIDRALTLANLSLALLAVTQTVATWRVDLVAGRRRLRVAVLTGTLAYIAVSAAANLSPVVHLILVSPTGNLARTLGLCLLAALAGWEILRVAETDRALAPVRASAGHGSIALIETENRSAIEPALLSRLERLMTVERTYRREGLTIGSLAALMRLPEYRLRQIINEGLGHRNFNAFLNRYRIDEAKMAFADSSQKDVPVLTIAMDAGFQSLGPFNRAFKADTGQTPTEFRRLAFAKAPSEQLSEAPNPRIGQPR
ncbi:AraC family transcriptional regulator [Mesorhizobium sp. M7A.F.Ca.US.001.01.1.1]|nr:AraC family transcriptional regulator [Mesorhizobium sp. M7A.F.Ca.US.001.01.1.1]